ncbi:beta-galactosidase [Actinoplanes sp. SE50]|nr:Beta-galactosidase [Actinoplanes sp. SE50/110]ATO85003.1 beta-galactosidase [Actinoplanes sp. SE50]SLM02412.1 beta-galactosidase [Actinoplanes sp. SE50/110]
MKFLLALLLALGGAAVPAAATAATEHTVTFDRYSLMLDGRRTFVWSGEFHPYRLPSPDLWRDVLQKMKANGYTATSVYFDWGYHSPAPGVYDFRGVRDMDRLLDIAAEVGLYVIARPGPYINAEVDAGGFPGWLTTQAGKARTDAPDYLAASDEWLGRIDAIIRRHQYTDGHGPVILYQIENELAAVGDSQKRYMRHLYDRVRADGITVPIFHNDKGRNGYWTPPAADLYAFDGYPGGTCRTDGTVGAPAVAPDWGMYGPGGPKGGATASPDTPGFVAEFGGGWFDYWGSAGTYPCTAQREGPGYERVFYGTNIANRLSIQNFYMTFGGTSWGWLPAPVVYTSYDYGAAIAEDRSLRPKVNTMRELGYFLQSTPPITKLERGPDLVPSSGAIKVYHPVNPDDGTQFLIAVHNPSNARTDDTATVPLTVDGRAYTVPLRINGQDAKILTAAYDVSGQRLVYSTSELMTHTADTLLLYGRDGETGETVLNYPAAPVVSGAVDSSYDPATGDLRLSYPHVGLTSVRISGGGRPAVTLLIADQSTADTFWKSGDVLVQGPALLRDARFAGDELRLTGDTAAATPLRVWSPRPYRTLTWNGRRVAAPGRPTVSRSGPLTALLPGPEPVTLPALDRWRWSAEPEESDDTWTPATLTGTNSTTEPPAGQPVLTADDYGFHHGDVWYRGHYTGSLPDTVTFDYGAGGAGMLQAWLDGTYLGQHTLPTALASPPTRGTATFTVPEARRATGDHVLSIMVRNNGHNEDGGVNDAHKEGRGLISTSVPATWRIQGETPDPVRGVTNNGGLYGERHGWSLPGYPDRTWSAPPATTPTGTSWYRTTVDLHVPRVDDASIALTIGEPGVKGGHYRALIFVNGWNMGQYIADVGPQHTFTLPAGILDPHGHNTLALAVTGDGGTLEPLHLTTTTVVRGGVPVRRVASPPYRH